MARDGSRACSVHAEAAPGRELHGEPQVGGRVQQLAVDDCAAAVAGGECGEDVSRSQAFPQPQPVAWVERVAFDVVGARAQAGVDASQHEPHAQPSAVALGVRRGGHGRDAAPAAAAAVFPQFANTNLTRTLS